MHPFICYLAVKQRQDEAREIDETVRGRGWRATVLGTRRARRERSLAAAAAYRARAAAPGYGL